MNHTQTKNTKDQRQHMPEQLQTADHFYSSLNGELASLLRDNSHLQQFNFSADKGIKDFVNKYQCTLSAWPVIVDKSFMARLSQVTSLMPDLCYRALELMFDGDDQAFADYFQLPASIYRTLVCGAVKREQLLMRYDYLYQQQEIKLLEINAGSNVGGWELDNLKATIEGVFKQFSETRDWNVSYRPVMLAFMQALAIMGKTLAGERKRNPNLLLVAAFPDFATRAHVEAQLNLIYAMLQDKTIAKGTLSVTESTRSIQVDEDDGIHFSGKQMDVVFVNHPGVQDEFYEQLFKSHQKAQIISPDTSAHRFVGNKLLFALLHEPKVLQQLSAQEQEFIKKHVPWSSKVKAQGSFPPIWGSPLKTAPAADMDFRDYVIAYKDSLVLKKAESLKGDHVRVGKFLSAQQWQQNLEVAFEEGDWLVQEYCSPDQANACVYPHSPAPHHFIWGAFDFANRYGGSVVRAVTLAKDTGVINAALGAAVLPVVEDLRQPFAK